MPKGKGTYGSQVGRPPKDGRQRSVQEYAGGGKTNEGLPFHYTWSEQEKRKHINRLELRAARYIVREQEPREVVQST